MRHYLGLILAVGMICFPFSTHLSGQEPKAGSLRLSLTAGSETYQLGETIELKVTLENISPKSLTVIKPKLDVHSISFNVVCDGLEFRHTIFTPSVFDSNKNRLGKITLGKNEGILKWFKLPTFKPGVYQITAHYAGANEEMLSPPVKVTVATPEKDSELCAVLETSSGRIVFRFFPDDAPNTVINFIKLAQRGFYTNLLFQRVVPNFVIQGGCPRRDGTGTPGYNIPAEFNRKHHLKNRVSMARRADNKNSAGCQFFICLADLTDKHNLDGKYAVFAEVIEGTDVVAKIGAVKTTGAGNPAKGILREKPLKDVVIKKITIELRPKK